MIQEVIVDSVSLLLYISELFALSVAPHSESGCEIPSVLLPSLAGGGVALLCVFLAIRANHTAACKSLSVQLRQVSSWSSRFITGSEAILQLK